MKYILLQLILLIHLTGFSQNNNSFDLFWEEVGPLLETDYESAKKRALEIRKEAKISPEYRLYFLEFSLKNNDLNFFKKEVSDLILNYGYRYTRADTCEVCLDDDFKTLIADKKISKWLLLKSDKLYPEWIKNNPINYDLQRRLSDLHFKDQTRVLIMPLDSSCGKDRITRTINAENYSELLMICINNDRKVPNAYDNGIGANWYLILLHNLIENSNDAKDQIVIWNRILPFIEKTYFEGKIDDGIFKFLDQQLLREYNLQYYGFLDNVPIIDPINVGKRRLKYGFDNNN